MNSEADPGGVLLFHAMTDPPAEPTRFVAAWSLFLLVGLILVLVVLLGSFILVRAGRRRRAALDHKPAPPTASEDVWAMHRLDDDWDEPEVTPDEFDSDG
jgi:hypothetical protein